MEHLEDGHVWPTSVIEEHEVKNRPPGIWDEEEELHISTTRSETAIDPVLDPCFQHLFLHDPDLEVGEGDIVFIPSDLQKYARFIL